MEKCFVFYRKATLRKISVLIFTILFRQENWYNSRFVAEITSKVVTFVYVIHDTIKSKATRSIKLFFVLVA